METAAAHPEPAVGAAPRAEHVWLQKLLGEWKVESSDEGAGPQQSDWTEHVRSLGGLWIVAEGRGTMPDGAPATMLMTLGYDPRTERYVGTWVGSMMTHLWIYDGEMDDSGRVLTLYADGPDFNHPGNMLRYRDVIEMESDGLRVLRSAVLGSDGSWKEFMTMRYRRLAQA